MTNRLTVERSTTELLRNIIMNYANFIIAKKSYSFQLLDRTWTPGPEGARGLVGQDLDPDPF